MYSCIYEGTVQHRRFVETEHRFRNKLFLMYLDLDELETVFKGRWLWSTRRMAIARFRREHHLGDIARPLHKSVRELVEQRLKFRPSGPIRLLTSLSYFGYVLKPVSFYFCYDVDGENLTAIVAEVTNTPWGERHCYVIDARCSTTGESNKVVTAKHAKAFHVSPFMPMNMNYLWKISPPAQQLGIHVENQLQSNTAFDATLALRRREITGFSLARVLLRYPLMTAQVAGSIYWQALRLWWKRVTFYSHPAKLATASADVHADGAAPTDITSGIQK